MSIYNSHIHHGNVNMSDDVYYKLLRYYKTGLITVVCMQWFDEPDYDEKDFIRDSNDSIHVFETENMAIVKLNEWYPKDQIDPEYHSAVNCDNVRD